MTTPAPTVAPAFVTAPDGTAVVELGGQGTTLTAGDDAIWVVLPSTLRGGREVLRIDPATGTITTALRDLKVVDGPSHAIGVNGSIWVSSWNLRTVTRYDGVSGDEIATLEVGRDPLWPVLAYGDVWIMNYRSGTISRIDPETGVVAATIEVAAPGDGGPMSLEPGGGLLWTAAPNTPAILAIDPATNEVARTIELDGTCRPGVTYLRDQLFVGGCGDTTIIIDPETGARIGESPFPMPGLTSRLETGDRVWMVSGDATREDLRLAAVSAATLEVVDVFSTGVGVPDWYVTGAFDSVWVNSGLFGRILRVPIAALPSP
ncbi:MAG TPA: hypothetical protein VFX65_11555 [Candidatus Limnocylindrales bacterium]|nr:hypothetical protein [Candidatus Limnocylindrales bacterium]